MTKLKSRTTIQIINSLEAHKRTHESRGFKITGLCGVNEFNNHSLRDYLCPLTVHIYAKDEDVRFIEISIGRVKERTRPMCHAVH